MYKIMKKCPLVDTRVTLQTISIKTCTSLQAELKII
jgi:hypothetical protein